MRKRVGRLGCLNRLSEWSRQENVEVHTRSKLPIEEESRDRNRIRKWMTFLLRGKVRQAGRQAQRQRDRQAERQAGRRTGRQADRQT